MEKQNTKSETFYVWRLTKAGVRKSAGVAFFDETFGDFRVKLDHCPNNLYYIRCLGSDSDTIHYRMEVVHKDAYGKFVRRVGIGEGYQKDDEIWIDDSPFYWTLIVSLTSRNPHLRAA